MIFIMCIIRLWNPRKNTSLKCRCAAVIYDAFMLQLSFIHSFQIPNAISQIECESCVQTLEKSKAQLSAAQQHLDLLQAKQDTNLEVISKLNKEVTDCATKLAISKKLLEGLMGDEISWREDLERTVTVNPLFVLPFSNPFTLRPRMHLLVIAYCMRVPSHILVPCQPKAGFGCMSCG